MPPTVYTSVSAASPLKSPTKRRRSTAVRCLFGSPDHDQTRQWIRARMDEIDQSKRRFWNYDFRADQPLHPETEAHNNPTSDTAASSAANIVQPSTSAGVKWNWQELNADTVPRYYWPTTVTPSPPPPSAPRKHTTLLPPSRLFVSNGSADVKLSKENLVHEPTTHRPVARAETSSPSRLSVVTTPKSTSTIGCASSTTPVRRLQPKMTGFFATRKRLQTPQGVAAGICKKSPKKALFFGRKFDDTTVPATTTVSSRMMNTRL